MLSKVISHVNNFSPYGCVSEEISIISFQYHNCYRVSQQLYSKYDVTNIMAMDSEQRLPLWVSSRTGHPSFFHDGESPELVDSASIHF